MPWPTAADYQDAIQNPRFCFSDPELQSGVPEPNALGLPKPITGNFASVYQLCCGGRDYAVRCFLHPFRDRQKRYAIISHYLEKTPRPYMVSFGFLSQALRVRGRWYPILRMEWVDGETLDRYVERNLDDSTAIARLADRFLDLVKDLRRCSIAHGDLQHGNILIVNGDIRLIDYDGMYVPGLDGMPSHETGHRHYQHPGRTENDFGPHLDNFSAWVIYLSLVALSVAPYLWNHLQAGEEHLLFRQRDFDQPQSSKALQALGELPDGVVRSLLSVFQSCLTAELSRVPPLDGNQILRTRPRTHGGARPSWLYPFQSPAPTTHMPPSASRPTEQRMTASYAFERWALLLSILVLALSASFLTPSAFTILLLAELSIVAVFLNRRYHSLPEVRKKSALASVLRKTQRGVQRLHADVERVGRDERKLEQSEEVEVAKALHDLRTRFISSQLSRCHLTSAMISGIGPKLTSRLLGEGIRAASDVTPSRVRRVYGIGEVRASSLVAWRRRCVSAIRGKAPRRLPSSQESQIRSRYQALRTALQAQELEKRRQLADNSLKLTRLEREYGAYRLVTSSLYLRGILFPSSGRPAASQVQPAPIQASAQQPGRGVAPAWYRRRLVKAVALGVASLALVFCCVVFSRPETDVDRTEPTSPRVAATHTGVDLLKPTVEDGAEPGNTVSPSATRPTTRPSASPATSSARRCVETQRRRALPRRL